MISTRVGIQIREALLGSKSSNENKDLAVMVKKFDAYKVRLSALVKALDAQFIAMKQLNESRLLVRSPVYLYRLPTMPMLCKNLT